VTGRYLAILILQQRREYVLYNSMSMENCWLSCNRTDTKEKEGTEVEKERFQNNTGQWD
jgi:hypothetical protein